MNLKNHLYHLSDKYAKNKEGDKYFFTALRMSFCTKHSLNNK